MKLSFLDTSLFSLGKPLFERLTVFMAWSEYIIANDNYESTISLVNPLADVVVIYIDKHLILDVREALVAYYGRKANQQIASLDHWARLVERVKSQLSGSRFIITYTETNEKEVAKCIRQMDRAGWWADIYVQLSPLLILDKNLFLDGLSPRITSSFPVMASNSSDDSTDKIVSQLNFLNDTLSDLSSEELSQMTQAVLSLKELMRQDCH